MFNILNTILVAAIVTVEVYGLFLGVYLMLFEGVTTREGVVKALEGRNQLVIVCGQAAYEQWGQAIQPSGTPPALRRPGVFLFCESHHPSASAMEALPQKQ